MTGQKVLVDCSPVELWGGVECTIARIGNAWRNQLVETGHLERCEDLDKIAKLGVRTIRYPVLWEMVSPARPDQFDWSWPDERLPKLRDLGLKTVAGLIHHGSGPHYTNLLDPSFPSLLSMHAGKVAERYPWIDLFTPVNEPLTTARFSALYGHWYPHHCSISSFARALINQCRAVTLCMREIRRVTPAAKLVQTEDLGKVFSTASMADQADFENQRRWLSLDLLTGRLDREHPWWGILRNAGIAERELEQFVGEPCSPDIIGINHYLTSDRFLDRRLHRYPPHCRGGNEDNVYADAEAVRVNLNPRHQLGPAARLREAWARYGLPLAVTEVHHGCSREEQLRWFSEVWTAAQQVRREGIDVRAVTLWALMGSVDWNSLLMRSENHYECGAFDVRAPEPRKTALAEMATQIAAGRSPSHPVLQSPGWWHRPGRLYGQAVGTQRSPSSGRPFILVVQNPTTLAAFADISKHRGLDYVICSQSENITKLEGLFYNADPWAVLVLATSGPGRIGVTKEKNSVAHFWSALCAKEGIPLLLLATGKRATLEMSPRRTDLSSEIVLYGAPEPDEAAVLARNKSLVIRAFDLFGTGEASDLGSQVLSTAGTPKPVTAERRELISPTFLPDLVHASLDLLIDGETGLWDLSNGELLTRDDFAKRIACEAALGPRTAGRDRVAPQRRTVRSGRGWPMPSLDNAVSRFVAQSSLNPDPPVTDNFVREEEPFRSRAQR